MKDFLARYLVPGLVIQAVMVGGGYSTGRELVEFFLAAGPATGLLGMALTAALFSAGAMISFELARAYGAFDYRAFTRVLLGRFWVLYELGYLTGLALVISVVSSAAAELLAQRLGLPPMASSIAFMAVIGGLVFFGNTILERIISAWSVVFYLAYGTLFVLVALRFGPGLRHAVAATPANFAAAALGGLTYTGYNISILPALIFVARRPRTRREALCAGALAGPLILAPGVALLLTLSAFYPAIAQAPLPISLVLDRLAAPWLELVISAVILGALIKTGAGLLHGFNERLAGVAEERGMLMPRVARSAVAIVVMAVSIYLAAAVGLVRLIAYGYRYSGYYFLLVFVLPLLTRGLYLVVRRGRPDALAAPAVETA